MRTRLLTFSLVLAATAGLARGADVYTVDPVHSSVSFKIRHIVARTGGEFNSFSGTITQDFNDLDQSGVEFHIQVASIDTREPDRDKHLRSAEFFDAEKYPEINFVSHKITKASNNQFAVAGTLTMHGVSRPVTLTVTYLGEARGPFGATRAGWELETTLDRKEWGISWNKTLDNGGLILGDEVTISIDLEVIKTEDESAR
jgi:polyisoprenoid-binding protein YceI